jgi:hypothetical protein
MDTAISAELITLSMVMNDRAIGKNSTAVKIITR